MKEKLKDKLFYIPFIVIIIAMGCDIKPSPEKIAKDKETKIKQYNRHQKFHERNIMRAHVVTRDNCQYLIHTYGRGGYAMHKGDCTNPIHKCK